MTSKDVFKRSNERKHAKGVRKGSRKNRAIAPANKGTTEDKMYEGSGPMPSKYWKGLKILMVIGENAPWR